MKTKVILFLIFVCYFSSCTKPTKIDFQYYIDNNWQINNSVNVDGEIYMNVSDEVTRSSNSDEVFLMRDTQEAEGNSIVVENYLYVRNSRLKRIWSNFYYSEENSNSAELLKKQMLKSYAFNPLSINAKNIVFDEKYTNRDIQIEVSVSKEADKKYDLMIDVSASDY